MKIIIVGPGAMGCLFAALLCRAGHEVWLLARNEAQAALMHERDICMETAGDTMHIPRSAVTATPEHIGTADIVLVCVKAYDTHAALTHALPAITRRTTVLTLQNGLGNIEILCGEVAPEQVLAGTTAHGATRVSTWLIRHAGIGETVIGAVHPAGRSRLQAVGKFLNDAGIRTMPAEDITGVLWGKLLVNAGINPLTAIMRIKNGQILESPPLESIMRQAVHEGRQIADALGIALPYPDPVGRVTEVCRATAENISSMHQDILAGRKTEIDQINGMLVRYGSQHHVPTPVNSMLTWLVTSAEHLQQAGMDEPSGKLLC